MLFLFRGGILFEIEWAETGLGRGFIHDVFSATIEE
jgi:hypothetical protein